MLISQIDQKKFKDDESMKARSMIIVPIFDYDQLANDFLKGNFISKARLNSNKDRTLYPERIKSLGKIDFGYANIQSLFDQISNHTSSECQYSLIETYVKKGWLPQQDINLIYLNKFEDRFANRIGFSLEKLFIYIHKKFLFIPKELFTNDFKKAYCLSVGIAENTFDEKIKGILVIDLLSPVVSDEFGMIEKFIAIHELYRDAIMTKFFDGIFSCSIKLEDDEIPLSKLCINLIFIEKLKDIKQVIAYRVDDTSKANFMLQTNLYYEGLKDDTEYCVKDNQHLNCILEVANKYSNDVSYIWNDIFLTKDSDKENYVLRISFMSETMNGIKICKKVKNVEDSRICVKILQTFPQILTKDLKNTIFPIVDSIGRDSWFSGLNVSNETDIVLGDKTNCKYIHFLLSIQKSKIDSFKKYLLSFRKRNEDLSLKLESVRRYKIENSVFCNQRSAIINCYEELVDKFIYDKFGVRSQMKDRRNYYPLYYINSGSTEGDFECQTFTELSIEQQKEHKKFCFYRLLIPYLIDKYYGCYSTFMQSKFLQLQFEDYSGIKPMLNLWEIYKDKLIDCSSLC